MPAKETRTEGCWEHKQPRHPMSPPPLIPPPLQGPDLLMACSSLQPQLPLLPPFSERRLPTQIYVFKAPPDDHAPKELALLGGLMRRSCLSGISERLAPNFASTREGLRWMSGSEWNP